MMNRRTSIKSLIILIITLLSSWSMWKWFRLTGEPDTDHLLMNEALIEDLTEVIIPRTNTPGAKDAGVAAFVIEMIVHCTDRKTQNSFINGLHQLERKSKRMCGISFLSCTTEEKHQILEEMEKQSIHRYNLLNRIDIKLFGKPFIIKLKELTTEGYCTSQIGAIRGLSYDYIPGAYISCTDMNSHQKAWATN